MSLAAGARARWLYAASMLGVGAAYQCFQTYLLFYYDHELGLPVATAALLRAASMAVEVLLLPLWGPASDRTRARMGRRRPWLLVGAPAYAAALILTFAPPQALRGTIALPLYFVGVTTLHDVLVNGLIWINLSALFAETFTDEGSRVRASGLKQTAYLVGMALAVAPVPLIHERFGARLIGVLYGLGAGLLIAITACGLRERRANRCTPPAVPWTSLLVASRPFSRLLMILLAVNAAFSLITSSLPFYCAHVLQLGSRGTSLLFGAVWAAMLPAASLWTRWARRRTARAGFTAAALAALAGLFVLGASPPLAGAVAGGVVAGSGLVGLMMFGDVLLARIVGASGAQGAYYGAVMVATRVANGALVGITYATLPALFGYAGDAEPGPRPAATFLFVTVALPAALLVLGLVLHHRTSTPNAEETRDACPTRLHTRRASPR